MKKEDFKEWDRPEFMKTVEKFIKNEIGRGVVCSDCPFYIIYSTKNKLCHETYRSKINGCFKNDEKLTESAKAFKAMVDEEKMQEFKVGDIVRIIEKFSRFNGKTGIVKEVIGEGLNVLVDDYLIGIMKKNVVKTEDKPQVEPFELKQGMKVKTNFKEEILKFHSMTNFEDGMWYRCCSNGNINPNHFLKEYNIDWEATRKLNEVKEEPKEELYVIWNPKGNNPRKIHNSLKDAEKEAERLAKENPNQEFYVLKAIKKAKGQVKIEWE